MFFLRMLRTCVMSVMSVTPMYWIFAGEVKGNEYIFRGSNFNKLIVLSNLKLFMRVMAPFHYK